MPAPVKVFSSRDFRTYRAATSPVSHIADRFFNFITSTSPESTHARYAYATAYLGHEPPPGTPFVGSELDYAVREMLEQPPVIVLAQGPMQPWGLFGPEFEAERQSIASSLSDGATVVEPVSAVSSFPNHSEIVIDRLRPSDLLALVGTSGVKRCFERK
jgi:hypothetical protein